MYNRMQNGGRKMSASKVIKQLMAETGTTVRELAAGMGCTPQLQQQALPGHIHLYGLFENCIAHGLHSPDSDQHRQGIPERLRAGRAGRAGKIKKSPAVPTYTSRGT